MAGSAILLSEHYAPLAAARAPYLSAPAPQHQLGLLPLSADVTQHTRAPIAHAPSGSGAPSASGASGGQEADIPCAARCLYPVITTLLSGDDLTAEQQHHLYADEETLVQFLLYHPKMIAALAEAFVVSKTAPAEERSDPAWEDRHDRMEHALSLLPRDQLLAIAATMSVSHQANTRQASLYLLNDEEADTVIRDNPQGERHRMATIRNVLAAETSPAVVRAAFDLLTDDIGKAKDEKTAALLADMAVGSYPPLVRAKAMALAASAAPADAVIFTHISTALSDPKAAHQVSALKALRESFVYLEADDQALAQTLAAFEPQLRHLANAATADRNAQAIAEDLLRQNF